MFMNSCVEYLYLVYDKKEDCLVLVEKDISLDTFMTQFKILSSTYIDKEGDLLSTLYVPKELVSDYHMAGKHVIPHVIRMFNLDMIFSSKSGIYYRSRKIK